MSSYQVFFRTKDPPLGSVESHALLRSRGHRNLNQKLRILQDSGDWMGALGAIRNAKRGNPLLNITGWHYAIVVNCFRDAHGGPRDADFMTSLHEAIVSGDIKLNLELLHAIVNTYNEIDRPKDALKIIKFANERGVGESLGTTGISSLLTLAKCLNRHGLWKSALDIANGISPKLAYRDESTLLKVRAESHAMYGNWLPALKCLQDIEAKRPISSSCKDSDVDVNSMRFLIAHAASVSTQWDISLKFVGDAVEGAPRQEHISQLMHIGMQNLKLLRQQRLWRQALVLMRFLHTNCGQCTEMRNAEFQHSIILDLLLSSRQWEEAMRYYMYDCDSCQFTSDALRKAASKVLLVAGRPEAACRILGSSGSSVPARSSTSYEKTNGKESAYSHEDPSYEILENASISRDTLPRDWGEGRVRRRTANFHRKFARSTEGIEPDTPLSYRWTPKAAFNRQFLNPETGYSTNFSKESFAETSPPPPTNFYNRASGWTYWNQSFGLPVRKGKELQTAYCFSKTSSFQNIPSYKRSWKKYRLMQNLFPR